MLTYRSSAFDTDRSGAPDSGPRTPWSPVRAIRGRVARPLIDLEEPELAVSGTEGQVATTGAPTRGQAGMLLDGGNRRRDEDVITGSRLRGQAQLLAVSDDDDGATHLCLGAQRKEHRRRTSGYGTGGNDSENDNCDRERAPVSASRRSTGSRRQHKDTDTEKCSSRPRGKLSSVVTVPTRGTKYDIGSSDAERDDADRGEHRRSRGSHHRGSRRRRSSTRSGSRRGSPGGSRAYCRGSPMDDSSDGGSTVSSGHRRHRIKLRSFDGSGSFETFWAHFENCGAYNRWTEADKLAHLKAALTADAGQTLWDSDASATNTLKKLEALLRSRYSGSRQADKFRMELRLRRRRAGESLSALHHDIRRLMALAHPTLQQEAREAIACDYFIDAMDDADFALKVRERAPPTLDEALRVALQLEAWTKDATRSRHEQSSSLKPKVRVAANFDVDGTSSVSSRLDRIESVLMQLQGASIAAPPSAAAAQAPVVNPVLSGSSEPKGTAVVEPRLGAQHRTTGQGSPKAPWAQKQAGFRRPLACWRCGQPGHIQRNCQLPAPQPVESNRNRPSAVNRGSRGLDHANVYLRMQLAGRTLPCLLDSGCEITLVPSSVVEGARNIEVVPSSQRIWAANGTEMEIVGEAVVPLMLNGRRISTQALVSPDVEEIMLGADWLQEHKCVWDLRGAGSTSMDGLRLCSHRSAGWLVDASTFRRT